MMQCHRFKSCPYNQNISCYQLLAKCPSGRFLRCDIARKHCGSKRARKSEGRCAARGCASAHSRQSAAALPMQCGTPKRPFIESAAYSPPSTLASGGHLDACSHGAMPSRRKTSCGAGFLQMIWKLSATLSRATGIPGKAIQAGTGRPNKARTVVRAATSPC